MVSWQTPLSLDAQRRITDGSAAALAAAIDRGADLRIYTEFVFNEHVDVTSADSQRVLEVSEFGVTYLIDRVWTAGVMSLRQPIDVPTGFGVRPSMSFFLYNQDGSQALARPYLDGGVEGVLADGQTGPSPTVFPPGMTNYHPKNNFDTGTNAPSSNFVYDFGAYRFCVNDCWQEVFAHDANGHVIRGSLSALTDAFATGCEMKVGVAGLCDGMADDATLPHEIFVRIGPGYYLTADRLFCAGSHPLVRIRPAVPMVYGTCGWDFGWAMLRSDGRVVYRRCDPYTLGFVDLPLRCAMRWFIR